ncbi:MAG: Na/Pi cotransporter family protein [Lachnospiraceae bacterium]|nr:Na/Pi cotransporter family protein [Agathobacter sp.]MDD6446121.1 Na/Pi cotransporter family protein [Lachnospiraceae bacterium]MDY4891820.1 Na/Pi cotransporter family protein [Agathobacter sp.]
MNKTVEIIFGLVGGLAIFIFGMNMMSECLQKAAGDKMKKILSMLTKNPVLGVLAGALTTAVLQSSSATTVMVIGFVSAGLMTLPQAVSIILGANIGTTMTAQIIAFKISDYIYVFIFIGFLINFICKSEKIKNIGQTIFAFGLLFLGIETMGDVMKPLASSPIFTEMIAKVAHIPVLGVCVGTLMTLVVQSSSATIAVLQNFASQAGPDGVTSIIGLAGAIPILLGDNIGTTITALLASVGQSKDAKRTAVAHCIFNLSGAFLFIWLVKPYAYLIQQISPKGNEVDVIARQIANAHTGFNLTMTLLWIPLIWLMVKIVMKLVPDQKGKMQLIPSAPKYLDDKLVGQPAAALQLVAKEVVRCSKLVEDMLREIKEGKGKDIPVTLKDIVEKAEIEHELNTSITDYLSAMYSEGVMTEEQAAQSTGIIYVLCDIDRMADLCREIGENVTENSDKKQKLSKDALKELKKSISVILEMYEDAMHGIITGEDAFSDDIKEKKNEVLLLDENMRLAHAQRVAKKKCDAKLTITYNNIIHAIDRMGNNCVNLIDTALNQVNFKAFLTEDGTKEIMSAE